MAFGLGAGACFFYVALDGQSPSRFTNGRAAKLEENFLELTGAPLRLRTDPDPDASWQLARDAVDAGPPRSAAHRPLLPRPLRQVRPLPGPRRGDRRLRLRGGAALGHRLRGAPDDEAREPGRGPPLEAADLPARRPHGRPAGGGGARRREAPRGGPGRRRPRGEGDDRAGARRVPGPARAAQVRGRGRIVARGRRGLAVVRAVPLPGGRAPRDGRRQLSRRCTRGSSTRPATGTRRRWPPRPRSAGPRSPTQLASRARATRPIRSSGPSCGRRADATLEAETALWEALAA